MAFLNGNDFMNRTVLLLLTLLISFPALAAKEFLMRVDGMACPYCAYGIEKKLKRIEGVDAESIDVDFEAGVVRVTTADDVELTTERMERLFNDAGFSFRGMEVNEPES